jgi:hypothetical protein
MKFLLQKNKFLAYTGDVFWHALILLHQLAWWVEWGLFFAVIPWNGSVLPDWWVNLAEQGWVSFAERYSQKWRCLFCLHKKCVRIIYVW